MFELITALSLDPPRARGRAAIPLAPWLADHFPGTPLAPGTLLLELAAQIAGPLAEEASRFPVQGTGNPDEVSERRTGAVLGMVRSAVFRAAVRVPAEIEIAAEIVRREASAMVARVEVREGETLAMTAELVFAMVESTEAAWAARMERVARWRAAWTG